MNNRRMMLFIDGENIARRFGSMMKDGSRPRNEVQVLEPDVCVWSMRWLRFLRHETHHVLRTTYYTSLIGDEGKRAMLAEKIRDVEFSVGSVHCCLMPEIFSRIKGTQRSKGVDIKLTVDVLTQVHNNTVDTVYLFTGDADYIPLIDEVHRNGKQVYVSAFSSGLGPMLKLKADRFMPLDWVTFESS